MIDDFCYYIPFHVPSFGWKIPQLTAVPLRLPALEDKLPHGVLTEAPAHGGSGIMALGRPPRSKGVLLTRCE